MSIPGVRASRPRYLSLAEVARLTGRHPELLRQWCAAGRLPCERIGGSWAILEEHLPLVHGQPARGRRRAGEAVVERRSVVAAVFTDATRGRLVHGELVRRYALDAADAAVAPLELPGAEIVLVAVRVPSGAVADVVALSEALGGRVVADVDQPWALPALPADVARGATEGDGRGR